MEAEAVDSEVEVAGALALEEALPHGPMLGKEEEDYPDVDTTWTRQHRAMGKYPIQCIQAPGSHQQQHLITLPR